MTRRHGGGRRPGKVLCFRSRRVVDWLALCVGLLSLWFIFSLYCVHTHRLPGDVPDKIPYGIVVLLSGRSTPRQTRLKASPSETSSTTQKQPPSPSPSPPPPTAPTTTTVDKTPTFDDAIFVTNTSRNKPFLPCHFQAGTIPRQHRFQAVLQCTNNENSARGIFFKEVTSNSTPAVTTLSDPSCLKYVIETQCRDVSLRVPRVAHYVWYGEDGKGQSNMSFPFFVGVLSVVRFLQPCLIVFHGDQIPDGPYWRALLHLVPNILHVPTPRPRHIFGNVINVTEHSADVTRLQALIEYGGVYLDTDQYLLHPVDDLLKTSVTIGMEMEGENCGNGLIFSEPGAQFLKLWLAGYHDFNDTEWAEHSTVLPFNLSTQFPHLVKVVHSFFSPNYKGIWSLYRGTEDLDWSGLYGLHLYLRFYHQFFDSGGARMDQQKTVIGDMTRHILFGSRHRCLHGQDTRDRG